MRVVIPSNVDVSEVGLQTYSGSQFRNKLICRVAAVNAFSELSMLMFILVHLFYGNRCLFYGY